MKEFDPVNDVEDSQLVLDHEEWPNFHDAEVHNLNIWRGDVRPDDKVWIGPVIEASFELFALERPYIAVDGTIGRLGGSGPGKEGRNMDQFCVRLEGFEGQAICAHLSRFGVHGSDLEIRYGAEGNGPSIYVQDPEGNTLELKGPSH